MQAGRHHHDPTILAQYSVACLLTCLPDDARAADVQSTRACFSAIVSVRCRRAPRQSGGSASTQPLQPHLRRSSPASAATSLCMPPPRRSSRSWNAITSAPALRPCTLRRTLQAGSKRPRLRCAWPAGGALRQRQRARMPLSRTRCARGLLGASCLSLRLPWYADRLLSAAACLQPVHLSW